MENRGMRVNMNKTKVMISGEQQKVTQKAVRWPIRGVCGRGVVNNSIQCTSCKKWVHRKCTGIKGSMYKVIEIPIWGYLGVLRVFKKSDIIFLLGDPNFL